MTDYAMAVTIAITVISWAVTATAFVVSLRSLARENQNALRSLRDHIDLHEEREGRNVLRLGTRMDEMLSENEKAHQEIVRSVGRLEGAVRTNGNTK